MSQQYDIVIIGGGLVGSCLARCLQGSTYRVLVIDHQPIEAMYNSNQDNRGFALSFNTVKILEKLNIWQDLKKYAFPINKVHISKQGNFGFTSFDSKRLSIPALGYVVSASMLGKYLLENLDSSRLVASIHGLCCNSDDGWSILLENRKINTKMLVGADGTNSFIRERLGIETTSSTYLHTAIVSNIITEKSHNSVAFQRFCSSGSLALLPFGEKRMKCVWTTTEEYVDSLKNLTEDDYLTKLQNTFGYKLGKIVSLDKRIIFPVKATCAKNIVKSNAVLIGNAANTLHPIAAQGFNLGIRDAEQLASVLCSGESLEFYEKLRSRDHYRIKKFNEAIVQNKSKQLEMLALQFFSPLNRYAAHIGMGCTT